MYLDLSGKHETHIHLSPHPDKSGESGLYKIGTQQAPLPDLSGERDWGEANKLKAA